MFDSEKFVFTRLLHSYPLRPNFSGPHMFVYSFCKSTWFSNLLHFSSHSLFSAFSVFTRFIAKVTDLPGLFIYDCTSPVCYLA